MYLWIWNLWNINLVKYSIGFGWNFHITPIRIQLIFQFHWQIAILVLLNSRVLVHWQASTNHHHHRRTRAGLVSQLSPPPSPLASSKWAIRDKIPYSNLSCVTHLSCTLICAAGNRRPTNCDKSISAHQRWPNETANESEKRDLSRWLSKRFRIIEYGVFRGNLRSSVSRSRCAKQNTTKLRLTGNVPRLEALMTYFLL